MAGHRARKTRTLHSKPGLKSPLQREAALGVGYKGGGGDDGGGGTASAAGRAGAATRGAAGARSPGGREGGAGGSGGLGGGGGARGGTLGAGGGAGGKNPSRMHMQNSAPGEHPSGSPGKGLDAYQTVASSALPSGSGRLKTAQPVHSDPPVCRNGNPAARAISSHWYQGGSSEPPGHSAVGASTSSGAWVRFSV
jgi:hypothetical protein